VICGGTSAPGAEWRNSREKRAADLAFMRRWHGCILNLCEFLVDFHGKKIFASVTSARWVKVFGSESVFLSRIANVFVRTVEHHLCVGRSGEFPKRCFARVIAVEIALAMLRAGHTSEHGMWQGLFLFPNWAWVTRPESAKGVVNSPTDGRSTLNAWQCQENRQGEL
jgi:hypothetical protein